MSPENKTALDVIIAQVNKTYGKGSISKLSDKPDLQPDDVISTGSIQLDLALSVGGYRKGRIIELYGNPSAGKSTLCLHACANAQKQGKYCLYVDIEQSMDKFYAESLGVDLEKLLITQPGCGEEALEIVNMFAKSGEMGLIVVDSVAALVSKKELEGEIGDSTIGLQARMMSQAMRMLSPTINEVGCTVIFTNQMRQKIGGYGNPNVTAGGLALGFYASQRIELQKITDIKDGDKVIGVNTRATVQKNKCGPPKGKAEFAITFGKGIDKIQEIADFAISDGLLEKSGAWIKYNGSPVAQGMNQCIAWLKENPEIEAELRKSSLELRGLV